MAVSTDVASTSAELFLAERCLEVEQERLDIERERRDFEKERLDATKQCLGFVIVSVIVLFVFFCFLAGICVALL